MSVIKKPLVTEKMTGLQNINQYAFEVAREASKPEIKSAVEAMYPGVQVEKVRTIVVPSKPKGRFTKGGYMKGRTSVWKKAIVTLKEGSTIDFFSEI